MIHNVLIVNKNVKHVVMEHHVIVVNKIYYFFKMIV